MQRWEYTQAGYQEATSLGSQGWEAVGTAINNSNLLFKRPLIPVQAAEYLPTVPHLPKGRGFVDRLLLIRRAAGQASRTFDSWRTHPGPISGDIFASAMENLENVLRENS